MQKLVNPILIANKPETFTPYQVRQVQKLSEKFQMVSIPEADLNRTQKAPLSVLFYDCNGKLNLYRIGQHNVLGKRVTR
jgi:hypothetical protein